MRRARLCDLFGIDVPILNAPMGGGYARAGTVCSQRGRSPRKWTGQAIATQDDQPDNWCRVDGGGRLERASAATPTHPEVCAMQITIDQEDAILLERVLSERLSDLRMEVGKTENYDLRASLKRDEQRLRALIGRLSTASV